MYITYLYIYYILTCFVVAGGFVPQVVDGKPFDGLVVVGIPATNKNISLRDLKLHKPRIISINRS